MKHLSDDQLEKSIENVRARELETLSEMLKHLREIDRRKLFSKPGYTSLYDYAIRKLKYSGDQAHRRISAMRLLRDIPEIESKIVDGSLKLTHLTDAQTLFRKVEHSREEKVALLAQLENTTKTEAKKVLQQDESVRFTFEADSDLEKVVERLRGLHPHLSFDQLMKKICEFALEKLNPAEKVKRVESKATATSKKMTESISTAKVNSSPDNAKHTTRAARVNRYITAEVKREVWKSSNGRCENCNSTFALEFDHIVPIALGGSNERANVRLLCRNCNQRKGIEKLGLGTMTRFRNIDRGLPARRG